MSYAKLLFNLWHTYECLRGEQAIMYAYFISNGEYSNYNVDFVAIHEKLFSKKELEVIVVEVKTEFGNLSPRPKRWSIDTTIQKLLITNLEKKGFVVLESSAEFSTSSYNRIEDFEIYYQAEES